ncbi:hypothetical protein M406DRAFT_353134 [Cryphonectria parasitica EP155]|uniref:Uncharacterized protein n=1 Tax=Cryphonectria parasitica (strain ATCC 38755 / EP155) TaxID=660469 RepID=A0A9P5CJS1_CRYP1|nr:uncharacterized protein M406DRAFT_353134 [Cryphonectria parasitica EP155]KAF3761509.1 hypothetical protein M406DRAFT_353134 [Cryphonectria parasitica EP155]
MTKRACVTQPWPTQPGSLCGITGFWLKGMTTKTSSSPRCLAGTHQACFPQQFCTSFNLWTLPKLNLLGNHPHFLGIGRLTTVTMAKAKTKKQDNRANPISKKGKVDKDEAKRTKDPKASHLYTDDNPETTLHGTGFKDAAAAEKTKCWWWWWWRWMTAGQDPMELMLIRERYFWLTKSDTVSLVSERSLLYQWQVISTMYNRAKHHPKKTKDIEAAIGIFNKWLKETYREAKANQRTFKPLSKKTVESLLPELKKAQGVDTTFAEMYVRLEGRKRLGNVLVDDSKPEGSDWDKTRVDALSKLVPDKNNEVDDDELWKEDGAPSQYHLRLISWAWSPLSEYKLLKATTNKS